MKAARARAPGYPNTAARSGSANTPPRTSPGTSRVIGPSAAFDLLLQRAELDRARTGESTPGLDLAEDPLDR